MKKFKDLTEEEIINEGLRAVPEYMERIRFSGIFKLEDCVAAEVKRIETLYKTSRGLRQYTPMGEKDLQEMDAFTGYFIPFLTEQTRTIQQRYMKQRRVAQINAITANAIIPEEFKKVGLKAKVEGQKYRAKVLVSLNGTSVRFYVRYKDLGKEGIMDDVIKAVVDLKDALDRLGYGAVVKRD